MTTITEKLLIQKVNGIAETLEKFSTWQLEQERRVSKLEVRASLWGGLAGALVVAVGYLLR